MLASIPFLMAACHSVDALENTPIEGTQYNHFLGRGYESISVVESDLFDHRDAEYFAGKALMAANNRYVEPTLIEERDVPQAQMAELAHARSLLVTAITTLREPPENWEPLAEAQVMFDCWIENVEEGDTTERAMQCRDNFLRVMDALSGGVAVSQAFMVFFDFNDSTLGKNALATASVVARVLKDNPGLKVVLTGNADTSGPETYNDGLSLRRAKAVQAALLKMGIPTDRAELYAEGEHNLLVETPDNTKEPRNRRVDILVTKR